MSEHTNPRARTFAGKSEGYWWRRLFVLRWLPAAVKGTLLAIVAAVTAALWKDASAAIALLVPLSAAALWFWKGRKVADAVNVAMQIGVNHVAYQLSRAAVANDERPFFLYLRAFTDSAFSVMTTDVVAPGNEGRTTYHIVQNMSELLEQALAPFGRVVMLGAEPSADPFEDASLMVETSDQDWWRIFASLAQQARAVFLVPGPSAGVLREVRHLLSGELRKKVMVLMPQADADGRRAARWEALRGELAANELDLPPYDERGCLYLPTERLAVAQVVALAGAPSTADALRQAFRSLGERIDPSATSLREALEALRLARIGRFDGVFDR